MASRSNKYIMTGLTVADNKINSSDGKKTALKYSMRINLDPFLMLEKTHFVQIPVLHIKEGKA